MSWRGTEGGVLEGQSAERGTEGGVLEGQSAERGTDGGVLEGQSAERGTEGGVLEGQSARSVGDGWSWRDAPEEPLVCCFLYMARHPIQVTQCAWPDHAVALPAEVVNRVSVRGRCWIQVVIFVN